MILTFLLMKVRIPYLHRLSERETDLEDKLDPSIQYLQKLGPEHLDQILESSRWIFDQDPNMAFQVSVLPCKIDEALIHNSRSSRLRM